VSLLDDRVAIVTGGARGIGLAIAEALSRQGARLVIADSGVSIAGEDADPEVVRSVAERLGAAERLVALARERFGAVDIVVNNAAILRDGFIFKSKREDFERVIATNLVAPYALLAAATPFMRDQSKGGRPPGRIVNIVSSAGIVGNYGQSAYASAKAGLFGLTRVVAMDLARAGVACNAVAPFAATRVTETIQPANDAQAAYKAQALQVPAHYVSRLVAFLASNAHRISGQLFGVRGRELFLFSQPRPVARALMSAGEAWDAGALGRMIEDELSPCFVDLATDLELFNDEPKV
jgi:NAD(P)-dependent dehydrogenase (short-subunit alcohol dehydrogenase family)